MSFRRRLRFDESDDIADNPTDDPTHDFQATVLRVFGINDQCLTYKSQGCNIRLTDVHGSVD